MTVAHRGIVTVDRQEFLTSRWTYRAGQHVTILGRTGSGKTYLAYQLLAQTARIRLPAINMIMKPKDDTVLERSAHLDLRTVRSWPPAPSMWRHRPVGYTVWPRHTFDPEDDDRRAWEVFRATILDSYKRGNRILFADEVAGLTHELRHPEEKRTLAREMEAVWRMGRSMGTGVWAASQRPAWISPLAYSSADHLFLAYEPDERNRRRFDEIGGIDEPKLVKDVTARLPQHHFLYIRREDQRRCIVGP